MGILDNIIRSVTNTATSKVTTGVSSEVSKRMKGPDPWSLINVDDYFKKIQFTPEKNGDYTVSVESDYIGSVSASSVKSLKEYSRIKAMGDLKRYLIGMRHKDVQIFKNEKLCKKVSEKFLDLIGVV